MPTDADYLTRRGLTRHAGRGSLWAMAVSAVIVGEFSGWNRGLIEGGFGGMFVATLLITLMYLCLCCSIAELGTAMPFAGGAYAYARAAFGPWSGLFTGLSQAMEYVLAIASIVVTIGAQINSALAAGWGLSVSEPILWLAVAAVFVFFNTYDTRLFFRSALVPAFASILVLVVFWSAAIRRFDVGNSC
jgi:ethanolamine permease